MVMCSELLCAILRSTEDAIVERKSTDVNNKGKSNTSMTNIALQKEASLLGIINTTGDDCEQLVPRVTLGVQQTTTPVVGETVICSTDTCCSLMHRMP